MGSYGGDEEIITTKQIVCCFCCYFENATVNNNKCFILYVSICQFRRYFSSSLRGSWWHEADFFSHFYLTKVLAPFLRWSILKRHFQRTGAVSTAWSLPGPKAKARRKRIATSLCLHPHHAALQRQEVLGIDRFCKIHNLDNVGCLPRRSHQGLNLRISSYHQKGTNTIARKCSKSKELIISCRKRVNSTGSSAHSKGESFRVTGELMHALAIE